MHWNKQAQLFWLLTTHFPAETCGFFLGLHSLQPNPTSLTSCQSPENVAETESRAACAAQDLAKLKPAELTPLSPEVISRQATINIGMSPVLHAQSTPH